MTREDPALLTVDPALRRHKTRRRADMPLLGGVRPPIAVLLSLLLAIAVLTVVVFALTGGAGVPSASRTMESRIAADAAYQVRTAVATEAAAVRRAAEQYRPAAGATPARSVKALLPGGPSARGAALMDPHNGHQIAVTGEPLPLAGVDVVAQARDSHGGPIPERLTRTDSGQPRVLYFARVTLGAGVQQRDPNQDVGQDRDAISDAPRTWLLVVGEVLPWPVVHGAGRSVQMVDVDGRLLGGAQGAEASADAPASAVGAGLAAAAAQAANGSSHAAEASGTLLGGKLAGRRMVAGWASVAAPGGEDSAELGLTVVTANGVPPVRARATLGFACAAAGSLAALALLITFLLRVTLQRPLLRLHLVATRLAGSVSDTPLPGADPGDLTRPVPVPAFGEPARIGRALESVRLQLLGQPDPEARAGRRRRVGARAGRRRPGVRSVVTVCAVLIAVWALPLLFVVNRVDAAAQIPADVVADQQARTQNAADRVRLSLGQRYTDLMAVAGTLAGKSSEQTEAAMRRALADHDQYRCLYTLDRDGAVVARVGSSPLRTLIHAPTGSGITAVNTSGRVPSIAAYAQIPHTGTAAAGVPVVLFAEIDVHALNRTLSRPALGSVWLTDQRQKVLAATTGFRAFQSLPDAQLTQLAVRTESAPGTVGTAKSAVFSSGAAPMGRSSVAAATPLARTGPVAGLGWRVVSVRPAEALELTAYQVQWRTMLAGLLALAAGVACLGWLHIVAVRPLRALTGLAEQLAAGDRRTVLYPVNHDETGSVTRGFELLRQALVTRDRRPGPPRISIPVQSSAREPAPDEKRVE